MGKTKKEVIIELAKKTGVLRPRDLVAKGIPGDYLWQLHKRGIMDKVGRGLYVLADSEPGEYQTMAEACKRVPHGVVCLLSALQFHGITTQAPFEIWLAIDNKAKGLRVDRPAIRTVRFSGLALTSGIEEHKISGVPVRVYNPAKTVADCFKYRNKIGLDVCLDALRDCRRSGICTTDDLWQYAKICRVGNVMKPYMEAIS
jgi:predicted transcriptional regulator of viral defense system